MAGSSVPLSRSAGCPAPAKCPSLPRAAGAGSVAADAALAPPDASPPDADTDVPSTALRESMDRPSAPRSPACSAAALPLELKLRLSPAAGSAASAAPSGSDTMSAATAAPGGEAKGPSFAAVELGDGSSGVWPALAAGVGSSMRRARRSRELSAMRLPELGLRLTEARCCSDTPGVCASKRSMACVGRRKHQQRAHGGQPHRGAAGVWLRVCSHQVREFGQGAGTALRQAAVERHALPGGGGERGLGVGGRRRLQRGGWRGAAVGLARDAGKPAAAP